MMVTTPHSSALAMLSDLLVYTGAGLYFVVAYWFLFGPKRPKRDMDAACPTCAPVEADTRVQERSPCWMTCLQQGDNTYVNPRAL